MRSSIRKSREGEGGLLLAEGREQRGQAFEFREFCLAAAACRQVRVHGGALSCVECSQQVDPERDPGLGAVHGVDHGVIPRSWSTSLSALSP
jgi:hypothetical protein